MRYVLALVFGVAFIGCLDEEDNPLSALEEEASSLTSDPDKLIGGWYISAEDIAAVAGDNEDLEGLESYEVTYNDDGTFLQKIKLLVLEVPFEFADSGTWTLDGSTLTQTYKEGELFDDGEVYVFSAIITDVTLTLTDSDGTVLVFRNKDN